MEGVSSVRAYSRHYIFAPSVYIHGIQQMFLLRALYLRGACTKIKRDLEETVSLNSSHALNSANRFDRVLTEPTLIQR